MPSNHLPPGIKLRQELYEHTEAITMVAWSPDGNMLASSTRKQSTVLWNLSQGKIVDTTNTDFSCMAWSPEGKTLACISDDGTVFLWNIHKGWEPEILAPQISDTANIIYFSDGRLFVYFINDGEITFWNIQNGQYHLDKHLSQHINIHKLLLSRNGQMLAGITEAWEICMWVNPLNREVQSFPVVLQKQLIGVQGLAWSPDERILAAYGTQDDTIRLWNVVEGKEKRLLKGNTDRVTSIAFSADGKLLASKSRDGFIRFWRTDTWEIITTVEDIFVGDEIGGLVFHPNTSILAVYGREDNLDGERGMIRLLELDVKELLKSRQVDTTSHFYKNAKVVLLGDSGVGKSGLSLVLTGHPFIPTDSTHARHVWTFDNHEASLANGQSETREILLWDLAGQADYRLIHQLHLSEVSTALIVTDTHRETDPFAGVYHWTRALNVAQRNSSLPMKKILVLSRIDRGGIQASRMRVEAVVNELGLDGYIETSAKEGLGIAVLQQMIHNTIDWNVLPKVSSTSIFQEINAFLLSEKERGCVLSTINETYQTFTRTTLRVHKEKNLQAHFETCIDQIESQGLVKKLSFGNLILLQPELLDVYASALVNAVKAEPDGLGSMAEEEVRAGNFFVPIDQRLKNKEQEKLLLIAMIEDLLLNEITLRERAYDGPYLVFPSQSTRENPDLPDPEEKTVVFRFEGPLQNIYATLAVRLSHSGLFKIKELWRNAITYTTQVDKGICGMLLRNFSEGRGELTVFFDQGMDEGICVLFEEYVQTHLQQRSLPNSVKRQRVLSCNNCGLRFSNEQISMRQQRGFTTITCSGCDAKVSLLDSSDKHLALKARLAVSEMERAANIQRDREVTDSTHEDRWMFIEKEAIAHNLKNVFLESDSYQEKNFSVKASLNNPFYENNVVRDLGNFFGRTDLVRHLYQAISHRQCVSLVGLPHIGKSSLLKHIQLPEVQAQFGFNPQNILFISLDLREHLRITVEYFFSVINQRIIEQYCSKLELVHSDGKSSEIFHNLLHQISLQGYHLVMLMDEFDMVTKNKEFDPNFFSFLRALTSIGLISYVIASAEPLYKITDLDTVNSPFFNIFISYGLGPLTLDEAKDLIASPAKQVGLPFTKSEVNWVLELAGRHPFFLQNVCRCLFDQKRAQKRAQITQEERDLVQEQVYLELFPHFDYLWSRLNTKEQDLMNYEASLNDNKKRKVPELSESSLFRKFVREKLHFISSHMKIEDLEKILRNLSDLKFLSECSMIHWNIISSRAVATPFSTDKGQIVFEVINEALNRLRGHGDRSDLSPEWESFNILYYRYFKYNLKNALIGARLGMSARTYYRAHSRALEKLLNVLLDMEHVSLNNGNVENMEPELPAITASPNNLAELYQEQRALHIREQQLGPEHLAVASSLHGLATLYIEQRKYVEAEALYQRALHIGEQQLGPEHLAVASLLHGLATLYIEQRKYVEAEALYQRALHIGEQQLGPEHLAVASLLHGLATLYIEQRKYVEAEALYQRALHIGEQQLGPEHPAVASLLHGLAELYQKQGKYAKAEVLYQRALHIGEQQLGPEHPAVASSLHGLATLYVEQGKYVEAEVLYQRALHIREQQLGPEHLAVASSLHGLAELYQRQGKYAEAEALYQRALHIGEQQLGPEHPAVAFLLHGLATLYVEQGKYAEAEALYQRALHIGEQQLGPEHLAVAIQRDYAFLLRTIGRNEEASKLEKYF